MATRQPDVRQGPDIFLSYRRTDKEFVGRLVAVLEGLGPSVWWDDEIGGGEDWRDAIIENLASSRCLVIVFSEACNSSKQLRKELAVADHLDKEVIPVLIEQTEPRVLPLRAGTAQLDQHASGSAGKARFGRPAPRRATPSGRMDGAPVDRAG